MFLRTQILTASAPLRLFAMAVGAGLAAQACASGAPSSSGSSASDLGGGSGSGGCPIASLAQANVGNGACSTNSLGGSDYGSSCTGNGGEPEYWCADFAKWVWQSSGVDVSGLTPAAESFYSYGMSNGTLSSKPAVGQAVVFSNGSGIHHVAIVTQVNPDGSIETVSGDWGGASGSESHFASTSHVTLNAPAYPGTTGSTPSVMGMTLVSFVGPSGSSACGTVSEGGAGGTAGGGGGGAAGGGGSSGGGGGGSSGSGGGGSSGSGGGGSSGTGGSGDAGGGGGSAGSGGSGGTHGGADAGTSSEGGYAFFERKPENVHRPVEVLAGASRTLAFSWHDTAGVAPAEDLRVDADGRTVLQISSIGGAPFVRAGLDVTPLASGTRYQLVLERHGDALEVRVTDEAHRVLARVTSEHLEIPLADVVLPASSWRSALTIE